MHLEEEYTVSDPFVDFLRRKRTGEYESIDLNHTQRSYFFPHCNQRGSVSCHDSGEDWCGPETLVRPDPLRHLLRVTSVCPPVNALFPVKKKRRTKEKEVNDCQVWSIAHDGIALCHGARVIKKHAFPRGERKQKERGNKMFLVKQRENRNKEREREKLRATTGRLNGSGRCVRSFPINLSINVGRGPEPRNLPIIKYFPFPIDQWARVSG